MVRLDVAMGSTVKVFTTMPLPALLLRIALCLALVLNGSGYAFAATSMQLEHAGHDATAASVGVVETGACHDAVSGSVVAGHSSHAMSIAHDAPAPTADGVECCDGSQCHFGCMQQLAASMPGFPQCAVPVAHAVDIQLMQTRRAAPPLPDPIRPPIG